MNIIGISGLDNSAAFKKKMFPGLTGPQYRIAQGFDAAAALVNAKGVVAAAAEERFTRQKATGAFPVNALKYCLSAGSLKPDQVDYIAHGFSYEPVKSFFTEDEFNRERYEKVYSPDVQRQYLSTNFPNWNWAEKLIPVEHHIAHAASAFFLSGYDESLILVSDGMGEVNSMTVAVGSGKKITVLKQIPALHSLGILYGAFTLYLGFYMGLDEYKIMGLAPYGNPNRYFNQIMEFIQLKDDGTYAIPLLAKNKTLLEKETHAGVLAELAAAFGPIRQKNEGITQHHKDLAAALQAALQACQFHVLRHFKHETGLLNLCMAGGVALNCTANGIIRRSRVFKDVFIQPAAGDDGPAVGAALYAASLHDPNYEPSKMTVPLWGPEFSETKIKSVLSRRVDCKATEYDSFTDLCQEAARRLNEGQIIAWFQGRMEFGPRALGNRSILADPRDPEMRDKVNAIIKKREGFRPFAPIVTEEGASRYFEIQEGDEKTYAHMLFITQVVEEYREQLPAITHINGSARVQTVSKEHNPRIWSVLNEFQKISGMPVLLNTSFNVKGQPIVCTPQEALDTFMFANLDALIIGNQLVVPVESKAAASAREQAAEKISGTLIQ